ncbi:MAG: hypothetical protein B6I20_04275 [Bacteroidetes bacterium 4572_117]|nr:MAG: hypothetical protein B6I20_04275 [Bacteroidetes bacterium 4572_117]
MKKLTLSLLLFVFTANIYAQTRGFVTKRKQAKDHIALIIGNSSYPDMPLENPKNDANAVAEAFNEMGFITEKVIDADREQMGMAINRFSNKLKTARIAVFYFSGHGMQVDGKNFLLPIAKTQSTQINKVEEVPYRAINIDEVLTAMNNSKVNFALVALDACRNNPLSSSGKGRLKGLAAVNAPAGSLVMYATKAGQVAYDGDGKNSPFTIAFLKHIKTPGLDVNLLPKNVKNTVLELTNGKQSPGAYTEITQSFTFVPEMTDKEFEEYIKQQKGKLTELQIKQAEIKRKQNKEDAELARQKAELAALEKQIADMKKATASGGGDLDKMLEIMKQRKAQKAKLDAMRIQ